MAKVKFGDMKIEWPDIYISAIVFAEIMAYAQSAWDLEISGLGIANIVDNSVYATEIFVVKQLCNTGFTQITTSGEAELLRQLIAEDRKHEVQNLNLWFHSHGNHDVFFSDTDEETIKKLLSGSRNFLLSIIVNNRGHCLVRLDVKWPFRMKFEGQVLNQFYDLSPEELARIDATVMEKVQLLPEPVQEKPKQVKKNTKRRKKGKKVIMPYREEVNGD